MNRLMFATAALAAGLSAFASNAWSQEATQEDKPRTLAEYFGENAETEAKTAAAGMKTGPIQADYRIGEARLAGTQKTDEGDAAEAKVVADGIQDKTEAKKRITARAGKQDGAGVKKAVAASSAYDAIIAKYATQHGLPVALARAVVRIESNFRPNARGSAGEVGLMQIKPATARMMGYSGSVKGLYDPETNIRYGMKYLARAHELGGGDTCGTILRYNAGHAATRMNKISAAYCVKVKRHLDGA